MRKTIQSTNTRFAAPPRSPLCAPRGCAQCRSAARQRRPGSWAPWLESAMNRAGCRQYSGTCGTACLDTAPGEAACTPQSGPRHVSVGRPASPALCSAALSGARLPTPQPQGRRGRACEPRPTNKGATAAGGENKFKVIRAAAATRAVTRPSPARPAGALPAARPPPASRSRRAPPPAPTPAAGPRPAWVPPTSGGTRTAA